MEQHINLLKKIAWNFHEKYQLDWDDLFQEAFIAYDYAMKKYDPSKGAITTFLWIHIRNQLTTYCLKEKEKHGGLLPEKMALNCVYESSTFLENLSKNGSLIAQIVLQNSDSFAKLGKPVARKYLQNILKELGWSKKRISLGIKELQIVCSNS